MMRISKRSAKSANRLSARKFGWLRWLFRLLFWLILLALVFFSLAVFVMRFVDIRTSAFILDQNQLAESQPKKYLSARQEWIDIERISPNLILAAIASEDQKFIDHYGFDFQQIINVITHYK